MNDDKIYADAFLKIANNRAEYSRNEPWRVISRNEPARVIFAAIDEYAKLKGISYEEAAEKLSTLPNYGNDGEVGGVNVYQSRDESRLVVEYGANGAEYTWMTLQTLVEQANSQFPNRAPDWYSWAWYRKLPNDHHRFSGAC